MQRFLSAWIIVGVVGLYSGANAEEETKADSKAATDFTEKAREMNSDKYAAPPTKFRTGNVTPRSLDADKIKAEGTGFRIDLPSSAPIPTPTVYRKKLYVSGGFHSKEFYCFDAASGKCVWGRSLDDDGPTSAVCDEGVTVFNTESCTIFGLDADSGKLLWSHWLGDPLTSSAPQD
jgi:outer membrane protein assembly factor BamB